MKHPIPYSPRLKLREDIAGVFHNRVEHLAVALRRIQDEPEKLAQTRHGGLEYEYAAIGSYLYAFGYPLIVVCKALACATLASQRVFELRGTEEQFFVLDVTLRQSGSAEVKSRHPPGTKDFSVTNSARNLIVTTIGLSAGRLDLAREISLKAWDPPDADYLSASYGDLCTRNDQRLAYALREYHAGKDAECLSYLQQVRALPRHIDVWAKVNMIRSIVERKEEPFIEAVNDYLSWFEKQAKKIDNEYDPQFFLATLPIGLSVLACHAGILAPGNLPQDNPRFSVDLLQLSLQNPVKEVNEFLTFQPHH
jgi:hypothetical protein